MTNNMEYDFKDYKGRNGSKKRLTTSLIETTLGSLIGLFIIAMVGELVYGKEGFVELLASFF